MSPFHRFVITLMVTQSGQLHRIGSDVKIVGSEEMMEDVNVFQHLLQNLSTNSTIYNPHGTKW